MKTSKTAAAFFSCALILAGCSSTSRHTASRNADAMRGVVEERVPANEGESDGGSSMHPSSMKIWIPKFIATGQASGIMIEFTGVKKDKPLHARYAGVELRRYPSEPLSEQQSGKQLTWNRNGNDALPAPFNPQSLESFVLTTTINDVKQAFFKVPPGKYLLRQTREWADRSYIGDVTVREGNYSVIMIPVRIPSAGQP